MKDLIFSTSLFVSILFFCITAILGITYDGTGTLYRNVCILTFAICMTTFFICSHARLDIRSFFSIIVLLVYFIAGVLSGYVFDKSFLCFTAFSIPASCVGLHYGHRGSIIRLVKWLDVICVLLSVSLFLFVGNLRWAIVNGDADYSQNLSYFASLAFLIDLFMLIRGSDYDRFRLFETKVMRAISIIMLVFYPLIVFLSGGRGGFVVIIIGIIAFLFSYKGRRRITMFAGLGFVLISFIIVFYFVSSTDSFSVFQQNSGRVFSYIDQGGINMAETSGRDVVYRESWDLFLSKPIDGYGLFTYKSHLYSVTYPHNLLLEFLLQGGLLLALPLLLLLFVFFSKYVSIYRVNPSVIMVLPFIVYSFTKLMFSGSYMEEPFFWFSLMFVFNYKPQLESR